MNSPYATKRGHQSCHQCVKVHDYKIKNRKTGGGLTWGSSYYQPKQGKTLKITHIFALFDPHQQTLGNLKDPCHMKGWNLNF